MIPDSYLDLLSPSNRVKPRFAALTEAVLSQAMDLFALLRSTEETRSLTGAVGVQLDALGALCGVSRPTPSTPDEDFRLLLRCTIARNHWDGTNETLPKALSFAFPDRSIRLRDGQDGTLEVHMDGPALPFPPEQMIPHPAGIRLVLAES